MANKPILLDETFAAKLDKTNALLAAMVRESAPSEVDWNMLKEYAHEGIFGDLFSIGDMFVDTWRDTAAEADYNYHWQLQHIGNVTLNDGEVLQNRPFLQMHYAHPFGVQFSHQRAFLACPDGLAAGTYNIHFAQAWSQLTVLDWHFTLTQPVPSGGRLAGFYTMADSAYTTRPVYAYSSDGKTVLETVTASQGEDSGATDLGTLAYTARNGNLNSMQESFYGWNRWKTSALRQYLNSAAGVGQWWTAQDAWDIAPDQLATKAGFLSGCPESFIDAIKTIAVTTYPNTVYDDPAGNTPDITYDKVCIPSLEQMYISPQKSGEGEYWERWKRQSGRTSPCAQYSTYPAMITYAAENHASAQGVRLRSAYRGSASYAWNINSSGYVDYNSAYDAYRFSPFVVL